MQKREESGRSKNLRDDIDKDGEKRDHGHDANLAVDEDGAFSRALGRRGGREFGGREREQTLEKVELSKSG